MFGALMLLDSQQLPLAELRNAAARAAPRLGDADCPVTVAELKGAWGSADVPAVIARVPTLSPTEADYCLGELHRVVRAEHVPALCELALATTGEVRRGALGDAELTSCYSGEHGPLVIATWAKCSGVTIDGDGAPGGVPAVLRAALLWVLDNPAPTTKEERQADRRLRPSRLLLQRWLGVTRPDAKDLPLLQRLIDEHVFGLEALVTLGHLHDEESLRILREHAAGENLDRRRSAQTALARRGDSAALDALLSGPCDSLACGLTVASADRRRAFAEHVLALPPGGAIVALRCVQDALTEVFPPDIPAVDETALAPFEPLAAAKKDVDARVLHTLIAVVPACATARLADALLAHPASELFADSGGPERPWTVPRGDLGFCGAWPFLEVTRPEVFRTRLREGLALDDAAVRATCADLLLRLHDPQSAPQLLAWVQAEQADDRWFDLAQCGGDSVRAALAARAAAAATLQDRQPLLQALARLHGMPVDAATRWNISDSDLDAVTDALRAGDAAAAFLASQRGAERLTSWDLADLLPWREARIDAFVRNAMRQQFEDLSSQVQWQLDFDLHRQDAAARRALRDAFTDGRYATHDFEQRHLAAAADVSMLAFWIDELGANCCRRVVADEALVELFGEEPEHGDEDNEAVTHRLRRRLLPLQERLRWSKLANGYVVAGN